MSRLLLLLIFPVMFLACAEKDDDNEETTTTATTAGTLELMNAIDLSCGGADCFSGEAVSLTAGESPLQSMRLFVWIVIGFPQTVYDDFSAEEKELIPREGQIGVIESVREDVSTSAVDFYAGDATFTGCEDAPATGTFTMTQDDEEFDVEWTTPVMGAPSTWEYAGTYEKALTTTIGDNTYRFEFNCDVNSMAVYRSESDAGEVINHQAFYYENKDDVINSQFYMWSAGGFAGELSLAFAFWRSAANDIKAWITRTGPKENPANHLGYRYAINKANDADEISIFQVGVGDGDDQNMPRASWLADADVTAETVVGTNPISSGSSLAGGAQGCLADWDAASETATTTTLCTGLTLGLPDAPALDADGDFSMKWIDANVQSALAAFGE